MDLNDDQLRFTQALGENLQRLFFFSALNPAEKDAAALKAIHTAIDQIGEDAVRASLQYLHSSLRDKVMAVFK